MQSDNSYDVVVVGAGPGGLAAAWQAQQGGARVALIESSPWLGGQIWKDTPEHPAQGQGRRWMQRIQNAKVAIHLETKVVASPEANTLLAETPDGPLLFHWNKLILATGARELFVPFPGWTLPEVVGAGGLQALVKSGWPVRKRRIVVAGSGPLLLAVAAELRRQGAKVMALVEQSSWRGVMSFAKALISHPSKLVRGAGLGPYLMGIPYRVGWWPVRAEGNEQLERVVITNGSTTQTIDCDCLACAFGLVPNAELSRLLGMDTEKGITLVDEQQRSSRDDVFAVGELTGIAGVDGALVEGCIAGLCAAGQEHQAKAFAKQKQRWLSFQRQLGQAFQLRDELKELATDETIICRCEDVKLGDLKREEGLRAAKLQCRCAMGHCQGRVCGDALQHIMEWQPAQVRPPVLPVSLKTLAAQPN